MNLLESARFALTGVAANKMRSILTTLGILIGIAAVIILLAVGAGTSNNIKAQIGKLGTNVLTVSRSTSVGGRATGGQSGASRTRSTNLTVDDEQALTDPVLAPDVARTAPIVQAQGVTATYTSATHSVASFLGTTPSYFDISNSTVAAGALFTDADQQSASPVAVIGNTVATDLFGAATGSAVGQSIQLNGQNFTVAGVLAVKGSSGLNDPDDIVVVPLSAAQNKFTGYAPTLASITVQAVSADVMNQAQNEVQMILDARHHVDSTNRDYQVRNQAQILTTATNTTQTLTILLGAVAAISLLVGGIGVMNIMLVTVTERTREIGIRKAIGASRGSIVAQFLIESLIISVIGGVAGIVIGFAGSAFPVLGVQPEVQSWTVWLSLAVSAIIGLVFGVYPANKAAKLRPIDALRYE
ncbi:MAG TPA: macrolide ABC transporter permease [Arthrobacter bacterium]|nr:macrolide ABC transporter permease [Arthrobacter sp.]HAP91418.1 macrolide ABC transporter permease [Arthrobacter sp.]HBH59158.1 macrolide ABC transporter permease [Arthrobacter sp.]HCB58519.1 macrolide ABC transporter permease [Arthrobacter sp.]HCN23563.1 macrolide ABC transporter permease [Arthrobacter sp.]